MDTEEGHVLVNSWTRSRSSSKSSSDGGTKPAGCFVEIERRHWMRAGIRFGLRARVDVRSKEGRVSECMVRKKVVNSKAWKVPREDGEL